MKDALGKEGEGIDVRFEFDQSPYVTRAVAGVVTEGLLGAVLVGVMILLFLRDWRSALVVVLNIPLALMGSVLALWITGQTINLMTLGGLALAIGILVDEATVEIENIHAQLQRGLPPAQAVLGRRSRTAMPRLLAMLCILAVFVSSFFMQGAARSLFVPLSLAVGFAMVTSYVLSTTLVPVLSVWLLKEHRDHRGSDAPTLFDRLRGRYRGLLTRTISWRWMLIASYLVGSGLLIAGAYKFLGRDIFPVVDAGQFRLRMRAPDGTHIARTEQYAKQALQLIGEEVGAENVDLSLGYVGMIHSNFPVNAVYQWSRGPEEVILYVGLNKRLGIRDEELKERLRKRLSAAMPEMRFSFEPSDIVNEVMSFGSPTPVEIAVNGPAFADDRQFAEKVRQELAEHSISARSCKSGNRSTIRRLTSMWIARKRVSPESSPSMSRAQSWRRPRRAGSSVPNYWADPKSGIAYQVQVEIPRSILRKTDGTNTVGSADALAQIPLKQTEKGQVLIGDVATLQPGTMPGQYDRYNMRRQITLTANVSNTDLATVSREVSRAVARAGSRRLACKSTSAAKSHRCSKCNRGSPSASVSPSSRYSCC